jgi:biotin carboxyl carrier protein
MRTTWLDGGRVRNVELEALGGGRYHVVVGEAGFDLEVELLGDGALRLVTAEGGAIAQVTAAEARRFVRLGSLDFVIERTSGGRGGGARGQGGGLESPMPGVVTRVMVAPGDAVKKGQALIAIEAMKMEHLIRAPRDGTVRALGARAGEMVGGGVPLVEMDGE